MRNGQAYCLLNDLSGLILPILCVDVSCCNFSGLLLGTTPWELYVCELVVWMKDYKDNKLIYIYLKENPYWVLEQNRASDQALNNTFLSSQGHQWERLHTGHILEHPVSSPKQSGVLQEQEEHARGLVASRRRSIPEFCLNPIGL